MNPFTLTDVNTQAVVYVATHGDKADDQLNPGMTTKGYEEINSLLSHINDITITQLRIISGTGNRHMDVADALGVKIDEYNPNAGGPDSLEKIDGTVYVVLSNGDKIPRDNYSLNGMSAAAVALVNSQKTDALICCGRPFANSLGIPDAKSGSLYKITGNTVEKIAEGTSVGAGTNEV